MDRHRQKQIQEGENTQLKNQRGKKKNPNTENKNFLYQKQIENRKKISI